MIRFTIGTASALCLSAGLVAQQAAPTPSPVAPSAAAPAPHTLLDGTPVKLRLAQTISSADAKVGQEVPFEVVDEVRVDDIVVLPKGGTAIANVTAAEPKRRMGRGGKLDMSISYARLVDGEKLAMRAVKEGKGGSHYRRHDWGDRSYLTDRVARRAILPLHARQGHFDPFGYGNYGVH